ncbi:short-chain collagen C4-like [Mytilus californianus]|uniref:short-chain collagen C4-like n=1 Tax=Mytilus californianus TaxID=6549 RepID=UPI002246E304|nr:short-chain collagen C4-like [Mytilus californianus]
MYVEMGCIYIVRVVMFYFVLLTNPCLSAICNNKACPGMISMPLIDGVKATLKADLDTTDLNNHLKAYIEQHIQEGVQAAMKDVMKQLVDDGLGEAHVIINATAREQFKGIGVTYTRWGRKACPTGAELVYTGQAGGNYFDNTGGGINYLCLPNDAEIGQRQSYDNSQLYGVEYEIHSRVKPHGWRTMGHMEVACAVCHSRRKSSKIIIPGRQTCYSDWSAEYSGYLMSSNLGHNGRNEFICVDLNAEPFDNRSSNENGALLYPIRTKCGSLRCPPYTDNADVLCVVCTK